MMEKACENPLRLNTPRDIYIGDGHPSCEVSNNPSSFDEEVATYCGIGYCFVCIRDICMCIFSV
jgi:hypothetical protein